MKPNKLTPKQQKFCELYTCDPDCFGNGFRSYVKAYGIDTGKKGALAGARASASQLLTNPNILQKLNELSEPMKMTDQIVDQELSFLISQRADFRAKIRAISEYNKLRGRIAQKLQIERPYADMSDEELMAAIEEGRKVFAK